MESYFRNFWIEVNDFLLGWNVKWMQKRRKIWHMAPLCLYWCMRIKCNQRIFCEEKLLDQRLNETFLKSLLGWSQDQKKKISIVESQSYGCDQRQKPRKLTHGVSPPTKSRVYQYLLSIGILYSNAPIPLPYIEEQLLNPFNSNIYLTSQNKRLVENKIKTKLIDYLNKRKF